MSNIVEYRGKTFSMPALGADGYSLEPNPDRDDFIHPGGSPVYWDLNTNFNLARFSVPRTPIEVKQLSPEEIAKFSKWGLPRTLDMPIKFPGSDFRIPKEYAQLLDTIQPVADYEYWINKECYDEYYCYLTVDQGEIQPGNLQREAPCHVDGFQGARWNPKVKCNHTYTVGDVLPTMYYPQVFDFSQLDETKHDFFWEMNRQIANVNSKYTWQPNAGEITLMDCYCVHRGVEATEITKRTWIRLSFEVRIFDRLGNTHNPMFDYKWEMVDRDIENLGLVPFDPTSDPSLRVFPWQNPDGTPILEKGKKTKPKLRKD